MPSTGCDTCRCAQKSPDGVCFGSVEERRQGGEDNIEYEKEQKACTARRLATWNLLPIMLWPKRYSIDYPVAQSPGLHWIVCL